MYAPKATHQTEYIKSNSSECDYSFSESSNFICLENCDFSYCTHTINPNLKYPAPTNWYWQLKAAFFILKNAHSVTCNFC